MLSTSAADGLAVRGSPAATSESGGFTRRRPRRTPGIGWPDEPACAVRLAVLNGADDLDQAAPRRGCMNLGV